MHLFKFKILTFFFGFLLLGSCNEEQQTANNNSSRLVKANGGRFYGKTFKLRESGFFRSLDPHNIVTIVGARVSNQIYEGLVKLNKEDLSIEPCLATSWDVDKTEKIYTFHIREGVYFNEDKCFGKTKTREVTAYDFEYCLNRLCEYREDNQLFFQVQGIIQGGNEYFKSTKIGKPLKEKVKGIKVIDDYSLQITANTSSDQFLYGLTTSAGKVFPKEAIEYYEKGFGFSPVGTEPFYLSDFKRDEFVLLKRNPNYWRKDSFGNQLPYLDGVHISFNNRKLDEIMDFRKGKLDLLFTVPVQFINQVVGNIEAAKKGKNNPFIVQTTPQMGTEYLGFNHLKPPFNNQLVRKAFALAIDNRELTIFNLKGDGLPAKYGFVPSCLPLYPYHNLKGNQYNPEKARELLAEAGYPNGENFPEIKFHYNFSEKIYRMVTGVKKILEKNLNIKITPIRSKSFNEHIKTIETGKAQLWRLSWFSDYPTPQNNLVIFYSGLKEPSNKIDDFPKVNKSHYYNSKFDSLFVASTKTSNLDQKMDLLLKADQILIDDAAIIPLYYNEAIRLVAPNVENFPINPMELRDFTEVYFRPQTTNDLLVISGH